MRNFIFIIFTASLLTAVSYGQNKTNENSKFKISFSERFRIETWDNTITLSSVANAGTSYNRNLTNIMFQWIPSKNFESALMLSNENRYYFTPTNKNFIIHEVYVDQLYLKYTDKFGSITLGRQNIMFGEGFIVMDGTPLDGSRSAYFNACNIEMEFNKTKKLNAFITYVPDIDNILPLINKQDQKLIEQPEFGTGFYFTGQFNKINLQSYYIYKYIFDKYEGPRSNIHTIGTRLALPINKNLSIAAEGAYQFGNRGYINSSKNRSSFGGYAYIDYTTKLNKPYIPESITFGGIYLSGNESSSDKIKGWDPVFSRWPKWSESYIYTLINEFGGKPAYWSNLASIYGKVKFNLINELSFGIDYHHLFAPQKAIAGIFPNGTGNTRGDLVIAKLMYKINNNLAGYILWESFIPGNYYTSGASKYNWARVELKFKI